jgi:capsular polysaccharide biosynthesis protein
MDDRGSTEAQAMSSSALGLLPPHLDALRRGWRLIAVATVVAVVITFGTTVWMAQVGSAYTAESAVLLTGSKYRLQLDPRFETVDQLGTGLGVSAAAARAEEFRTVAQSSAVRQSATQALAGVLDAGQRLPNGELDASLVDVRVRGSLIVVSASAESPQKAARIADAYAAAVAQAMDRTYGPSEQDREALEQQLVELVRQHEEAGAQLSGFLRTSRLSELQRSIAERMAARDTIVNEQVNVLKTRVTRYYAGLLEIDRVANDLGALRKQVEDAGESGPSLLAHSIALVGLETRLINLETTAAPGVAGPVVPPQQQREGTQQATDASGPVMLPQQQGFPEGLLPRASNPVVPTQVQIDGDVLVSQTSRQQLLADIDATVKVLEARRADFRQAFESGLAELQRQIGQSGGGFLSPERIATDQTAGALVQQLDKEI